MCLAAERATSAVMEALGALTAPQAVIGQGEAVDDLRAAGTSHRRALAALCRMAPKALGGEVTVSHASLRGSPGGYGGWPAPWRYQGTSSAGSGVLPAIRSAAFSATIITGA